MRRFRRPWVSRTEDTLARLDVLADIVEHAAARLEQSARQLDEVTNRHLKALENGGNDAET